MTVGLITALNQMFKQNENWTHEFETIFGGKYTMHFTKNGDDWVFGLYDGSTCIGEKKCHKWHEPDNFVYFADKCITHPDDSNVDCAYLAEPDYKIKVEKTCDGMETYVYFNNTDYLYGDPRNFMFGYGLKENIAILYVRSVNDNLYGKSVKEPANAPIAWALVTQSIQNDTIPSVSRIIDYFKGIANGNEPETF